MYYGTEQTQPLEMYSMKGTNTVALNGSTQRTNTTKKNVL
jgi:hypothetical protein